MDILPSDRKNALHRRLVDAYGKVKSRSERMVFRRDLAKAVGRSEQAVGRWVGAWQPPNGPPSTVLDALEAFLEGRKK